MAGEDKKQSKKAAAEASVQGADLEALQTKLKAQEAEIERLKKELAESEARRVDAERRIKSGKAAPANNAVYIGGQVWQIKGTVKAKFALDHVKKGFIPEDVALIITDYRE